MNNNIDNLLAGAKEASKSIAQLSEQRINSALNSVAELAILRAHEILTANALDIAKVDESNPMRDRLLLTYERIEAIAADIRSVARLSSPISEVLSTTVRPNGMRIDKVRVPFGVIGVIYEARPNVSFDVFALCLKSSNVCILKGGSDAENSNRAIVEIIRAALRAEGIDERAVTLLPSKRWATAQLLEARDYVDLIIPRGGRSLIDYVRENSRVPIIETGAGVCHTYIDKYADTNKAAKIVENAKCRRVSVCNALDSIVVHSSMLGALHEIIAPLAHHNVKIYADEASHSALINTYPQHLLELADDSHYGVEWLDHKLSIRTVSSLDEAIAHIGRYTSHHSEAIITEDSERGERFTREVDAACVYVNVSTAFTDGAQFGFGAEIGISTQKMHARGPMALAELTVYKYVIRGNGQTRQ